MKKNQWIGKAAGVLMGTLVAVLVCGMPGADKAFAKTQTPQEAAEKVTQAWQTAGSQRKTKTVQVTLASSKQNLWKTSSAFTAAVNAAIYDNAYLSEEWDCMATEWMNLRVRKIKKGTKGYTDEVTGVKCPYEAQQRETDIPICDQRQEQRHEGDVPGYRSQQILCGSDSECDEGYGSV